MYEIRWHGRGGQGIVYASEILAAAAFREGKFSQAFPLFGAERRGAPVTAYTRIDDSPILLRSQIYEPDIVVVLDPKFSRDPSTTKGLKENGLLILNTAGNIESQYNRKYRVAWVDATRIAINLGLKVAGLPVPNTAMLGAFSKATGLVRIDTICSIIRSKWSGEIGDLNSKAAKLAYEKTKLR